MGQQAVRCALGSRYVLGGRFLSRTAPMACMDTITSPPPPVLAMWASVLTLCLAPHRLTQGPGELGAFSDSLYIMKESGDLG